MKGTRLYERGTIRPFFEAPAGPGTPQRRLLLISIAFPPDQTVGALRWEKLAPFAAERGWALDVITMDPTDLPSTDYSRLEKLPPGTRVFGVSKPARPMLALERSGKGLYRSLMTTRRADAGNASIPHGASPAMHHPESLKRSDIHWRFRGLRDVARAYVAWSDYLFFRAWAVAAADIGVGVIDPALHDAVVTSAPPHMAHEAGRLVSSRSGLSFVMDMRDPWSLAPRLPEDLASPVWLHLARRYERRAVKQAALVVANTDPFAQAMRETYPWAAERIITVNNGCDDEPLPQVAPSRRFTIAYAGSLYYGRDPRPLFRAVARLVRELGLLSSDIGLELIGDEMVERAMSVSDLAREEGVAEYVSAGPARPRNEALEFLARSTMLVSLDRDNYLTIPAKLFEYIRFDAWVLAFAERNSAPELRFRDSGMDLVEPDDVDAIVAVLRKRYVQFREGIRPTAIVGNGKFSRRIQADILFDAMTRVLSDEARNRLGGKQAAARPLETVRKSV